MNTLMLIVLVVVVLCYYGGKYCPTVLSSNKELVLGVLVGLALCSFAGLRLEGLQVSRECCRNGSVQLNQWGGESVVWEDSSLGQSTELPDGCMAYGPQRAPGQDGSESGGVNDWDNACNNLGYRRTKTSTGYRYGHDRNSNKGKP
jgi:hypothetical protein